MKKMLALLVAIMFVITCLTACTSSQNANSSDVTEATEVANEDVTVSFDGTDLVSDYCEGNWDGSFISNDKHCASILDGKLWIDCQIAENIPDMGPFEDCFWDSVVSSSSLGTWIYDRQLGTIELWKTGTRYKKFATSFTDNYLTNVYVLSNCIVARNKTELSIYTLEGYNLTNYKEIIDCCKDGDSLLFSNFKHENYKISKDGEVNSVSSNYVRFPVKNTQLQKELNCCTLPFNNYWSGSWNGDFTVIDNNHYFVDFYGDIYINNELVGNVNLGISNKITENSENLLTSIDESLYLDGKDLIIYKKGEESKVDVPDGQGRFLWSSGDNGVAILIYGNGSNDNKLIIVKNGATKIISNKVTDANLAYDTLYYMEGDKVYSLAWQDDNAESHLFFEGAYAVSQRTDELEGAIVPTEKNNMKSYGESNLYSPYGEK